MYFLINFKSRNERTDQEVSYEAMLLTNGRYWRDHSNFVSLDLRTVVQLSTPIEINMDHHQQQFVWLGFTRASQTVRHIKFSKRFRKRLKGAETAF